MGSGELIPCFALLTCMAFALPVKLSLFQPTSFLHFHSSNSLPHPTGGE